MIRTMYGVYPQDSVLTAFVLRRMGERRLVVMEEYQDLVCRKCGKVNEKSALARGIQPDVVVNSKRPFLGSADNFYLLDERGKQVFSAVLPDQIEYYRIPSSAFYVASARVLFQPDERNPGFRFVRGRCKQCGRPGEVIWSKIPPTIADVDAFLSINLEGTQGARETWLVSDEIATQLKIASPPLSGMVLDPKEVDDGDPIH
jgi:hypothetical protein